MLREKGFEGKGSEKMVEIIECGMVNCYLLKGKDGSVLIDTGNAVDKEKVYHAVKDQKVKLIILTHGHNDHISNAAYLKEKLHVPIAMHEADYRLSKDNTSQPCYARTLIGKMVLALSRSSFKNKVEAFEPDLFIEEGDDLIKYGINAEIIGLPGHTDGSIGIWTKTELIVGDAMMNFFKPYGARLYKDKQAADQSLEKIKNSNVLLIYPGHGKPIERETFFK